MDLCTLHLASNRPSSLGTLSWAMPTGRNYERRIEWLG